MIQESKKCLFCGQLYIVDKHDVCKKCVFSQHSSYSPHYVKPTSYRRNALSNPEFILDTISKENLKIIDLPNISENPELYKKNSLKSTTTSNPTLSRKSSLKSLDNDFDLVDVNNALADLTPERRKTLPNPDELKRSISPLIKNFDNPLSHLKPKSFDRIPTLPNPEAFNKTSLTSPNPNLKDLIQNFDDTLEQIVLEKRKALEESVFKSILKHTKSEPKIKINLNDTIHLPTRRNTIGNTNTLKNLLIKDNISPNQKSDFEKKAQLKVLQNKITDAKQKLKVTKKTLEQFSISDMSASYEAARIEYSLAEREVEEACRNWCKTIR